jgi:hypothetical protein
MIKNLEVWNFYFFLQNLGNLGLFFPPMKKSFVYRSNSYFSGQNLAKLRPQKRKEKTHPNLHITYPTPAQIPQKMVYFSVG